MIPLRVTLDFLTYSGTPPTNNPEDETRSRRKVEEKSITADIRAQQQIAASASNVSVPLASSTNDYLAIFCDQAITVVYNGIGTPIALNPQVAGVMCPVLLIRGSTTSLTVSNPGSNPANIDVRSVKI